MKILKFQKITGSTNVLSVSSNFGKRLLAIQLQPKGKNSVSRLSMYTDMFIARPSDPKIFPDFNVCSKFFCHELHPEEFFSNEKTPIFICGAKANFPFF